MSIPSIKKLVPTQQNMEAYFKQDTVIRKTNLESSLNYGKVVIMADADVDG